MKLIRKTNAISGYDSRFVSWSWSGSSIWFGILSKSISWTRNKSGSRLVFYCLSSSWSMNFIWSRNG